MPVWPAEVTHCIAACRFFPSVHYLSTSKMAIAAIGNLAFALALCMYHLITKVEGCGPVAVAQNVLSRHPPRGSFSLWERGYIPQQVLLK